MTARDEILARIVRHRSGQIPLPTIEGAWLDPVDRVSFFQEAATSVGARVVSIESDNDLVTAIEEDPQYRLASTVHSTIPHIATRGITDMGADILRGERLLDITIAASDLAVAENAAVYLEPVDRVQHGLLFLCEHLYLIIRADAIVSTMHHAYQKLHAGQSTIALSSAHPGFGLFVSGPSKTADIEQALVIGAQGPRSLTILLMSR